MELYYYLKPTDIIEQGDEFNIETLHGEEGWCYCRSSVGQTIITGLGNDPDVVVRRLIKITKKGNRL